MYMYIVSGNLSYCSCMALPNCTCTLSHDISHDTRGGELLQCKYIHKNIHHFLTCRIAVSDNNYNIHDYSYGNILTTIK